MRAEGGVVYAEFGGTTTNAAFEGGSAAVLGPRPSSLGPVSGRGRRLAAVVDQPEATEAAEEAEAGAVELAQHAGDRVVDGFAQDLAELLVQLFGRIEALLGASEEVGLGVNAGGGRGGEEWL